MLQVENLGIKALLTESLQGKKNKELGQNIAMYWGKKNSANRDIPG